MIDEKRLQEIEATVDMLSTVGPTTLYELIAALREAWKDLKYERETAAHNLEVINARADADVAEWKAWAEKAKTSNSLDYAIKLEAGRVDALAAATDVLREMFAAGEIHGSWIAKAVDALGEVARSHK